jgi:hypothetical protein
LIGSALFKTKTKEDRLAAMASVYAKAYITIAACNDDAQSSPAGNRVDRPGIEPYGTFQFTPTCGLLSVEPFARLGIVYKQEYGTRA